MSPWTVAAFYHFADFPDYREWQVPLKELCATAGLKGTILLAAEGINSTIAGPRDGIDQLLAFLRQDPRFASLVHKEAVTATAPFQRLKIRLKKEIVTLGVPGTSPLKQVGTYVKPDAWNKLLQDPEILVVDVRNTYEVERGTFQGAHNPQTPTFRDFPAYVQTQLSQDKSRKVAMFCTGGIRCEKASAYMLDQGFETVYHLEGGILKYLETVPPEQSLWQGDCFVFDEREGVTYGCQPTDPSTVKA